MGLLYPSDLAAWQRWQARQNLPRTLKGTAASRLRPGRNEPAPLVLHTRGPAPRVLAALESTSPTQRAAILRPLQYLEDVDLAVLAPEDVTALLPGEGWRSAPVRPHVEGLLEDHDRPTASLRAVADVLAVGHYLPSGRLADEFRRVRDARFRVVQHGLLVPMAPPLPPDAQLLAFTAEDAEFWCSGREDVVGETVGSQLLWEAAALPAARTDPSLPPVYLGQLHGAELNRLALARSSYAFCREHGAVYRPHPGERDLASRAVHRIWRARGIEIPEHPGPLSEVCAPVVSAFSTGVLEAAARGLDAWVHHAAPPAWLREFWARYGLRRWGDEPTPPLALPGEEPAARISHLLRNSL